MPIQQNLVDSSARDTDSDTTVAAVRHPRPAYSGVPPYHPAGDVPECLFPERSEINPAYELVRTAFAALGWDDAKFGQRDWNPLRHLVNAGDVVLIKPNFVSDRHPRDRNGLIYTVTHGSVVRAVADYVAIALAGTGRIIVADAPQTDSSFERIKTATGLDSISQFYRSKGVDFVVYDLRAEEWRNEGGVIVERRRLAGDPRGYSIVDIGLHSEFFGFSGEGRYYGADYDTAFVNAQHQESTHRYSLANTALDCDVFVNIPKLKTHKKGGLTCNLKNLVGINGDKNFLPHHTIGSPSRNGDQFKDETAVSKVEHSVASLLRKVSLKAPAFGVPLLRVARAVGTKLFGAGTQKIRSGNWHGNNTVWRMVLDMNRILLYWNSERRTIDTSRRQKRYLSVVDAIIAGQGNGPMDPDPKPFGVVLAGTNPATVDAVAAVLMGFDPALIPTVREAFASHTLPITQGKWESIQVRSNVPEWGHPLGEIEVTDSFKPHFGWVGHVERKQSGVDR